MTSGDPFNYVHDKSLPENMHYCLFPFEISDQTLHKHFKVKDLLCPPGKDSGKIASKLREKLSKVELRRMDAPSKNHKRVKTESSQGPTMDTESACATVTPSVLSSL